LAPSCDDCFRERQGVMATTRHIHTYFYSEQLKRKTERKKFHSLVSCKVKHLRRYVVVCRSFACFSVFLPLPLLFFYQVHLIWFYMPIYVYYSYNLFFIVYNSKKNIRKKRHIFKWLIDWWIQGLYSNIDMKRAIRTCWKEK
jgi:hypothetical protein